MRRILGIIGRRIFFTLLFAEVCVFAVLGVRETAGLNACRLPNLWAAIPSLMCVFFAIGLGALAFGPERWFAEPPTKEGRT